MISWEITREKTYFDSVNFSSSETFTNSYSNEIYTYHNSSSSSQIKEEGEISRYSSTGEVGGWLDVVGGGIDFEARIASTSYEEKGFSSSSWSSSATQLTTDTSQESSSSGSGSSTWESFTIQETTTAILQTESILSTTSTVQGTFSYYTTVQDGTGITLDTVSSTFKETNNNGQRTVNSPYVATIVKEESITVRKPIEYGTVVEAAKGEVLYSLTFSPTEFITDNTQIQLLSDIAHRFTKQTFWAKTLALAKSFHTYSNSERMPYSNPDATSGITETRYSVNPVLAASSVPGLLNSLPLETALTEVGVATTVSFSYFAGGEGSYTDDALLTTNILTTYTASATLLSTTLIETGVDHTTAKVTGDFETLISINRTVAMPDIYLGSVLVDDVDEFGESFYSTTQRSAQTDIVKLGFDIQGPSRDIATYFEPVPKSNGMKLPKGLSEENIAGTNYSLNSTIYYPFFSSVQQGVVSPVIFPFTSVGRTDSTKTALTTLIGTNQTGTFTYEDNVYTDVSSWSYKGSENSLSWTSRRSYLEGSRTLYSTNSGKGVLGTVGNGGGVYWEDGDTVFGGFAPIKTVAEIGMFPKGAYIAAGYDSRGNSTTLKGIRSEFQTSTLKEDIRVEQAIQGYVTNIGRLQEGDLPVFTFSFR